MAKARAGLRHSRRAGRTSRHHARRHRAGYRRHQHRRPGAARRGRLRPPQGRAASLDRRGRRPAGPRSEAQRPGSGGGRLRQRPGPLPLQVDGRGFRREKGFHRAPPRPRSPAAARKTRAKRSAGSRWLLPPTAGPRKSCCRIGPRRRASSATRSTSKPPAGRRAHASSAAGAFDPRPRGENPRTLGRGRAALRVSLSSHALEPRQDDRVAHRVAGGRHGFRRCGQRRRRLGQQYDARRHFPCAARTRVQSSRTTSCRKTSRTTT